MLTKFVTALLLCSLPLISTAEQGNDGASPIQSGDDTYYFVSHFQITIDRPASVVWRHLVNPGSWMFEFDMIHESGVKSAEGEIFRLYAGQEFFFEVIGMIPDKLYLGVNLPSTFKGEFSIGTAVITLTQFGRKTVVNCTLSRQYRWTLEGPNPMREIRQSEKFRESTRVTWEDKFLVRLRELAENDEVDP